MRKVLIGVFSFVVAVAIGFFGLQFFTHTGLFKIAGKLVFSEDFSDEEKTKISGLFSDFELEQDVLVSKESDYVPLVEHEAKDNKSIYRLASDILVPVGGFYEADSDISTEEFRARVESPTRGVESGVVSVAELDKTMMLQSVDGEYFLDTFESGAYFEYVVVMQEEAKEKSGLAEKVKQLFGKEEKLQCESEAGAGENSEEGGAESNENSGACGGELERVKEKLGEMLAEMPSKDSVLSFAQTGVTALSRNMNTKIAQVGSGEYFAENIGSFLGSFDLTHTSNESSFTGYASKANICSDWRFKDTLLKIGLDVVELTGNHNQDCGDTAALETIEWYRENGIRIVGGGENAEKAAEALEISEKGNHVTMLAYNQSTGGATYDGTPGANQYYEEDARAKISTAKERGDTVIVDVQYYECNEYNVSYEYTYCDRANSSAGDQVGLFRSLIDMGADLVIGTSAHQTQTYELYNGGVIYYGLGNLFFDQIWWPGTTRSLGVVSYCWNNELVQTRRFGTVYDESYQTRVMNSEELEWFVNRLNEARP